MGMQVEAGLPVVLQAACDPGVAQQSLGRGAMVGVAPQQRADKTLCRLRYSPPALPCKAPPALRTMWVSHSRGGACGRGQGGWEEQYQPAKYCFASM